MALTKEQVELILRESAPDLWDMEACVKDGLKPSLARLHDNAVRCLAAGDATNEECDIVTDKLAEIAESVRVLELSLRQLHKDSTRMIESREMIVPLSGGGKDPGDDDEIPPEGGG